MFWTGGSIETIRKALKNCRIMDALIVVISAWIVVIGVDLVLMAQEGRLGLFEFIDSIFIITFSVFVSWLAMSGLAYLLALGVGGKGNYRCVLIASAFAAWPITAIGLLIIAFNFFATILGVPSIWIISLSLVALWFSLLLGFPGYYMAVALHAVTGIKKSQAYLICAMLVVFVTALLIWQSPEYLCCTF